MPFVQKITDHQKNLLEVIAEDTKSNMPTENDVQYALKGLLTEITHIATGEYFSCEYIAEKAKIICLGLGQ